MLFRNKICEPRTKNIIDILFDIFSLPALILFFFPQVKTRFMDLLNLFKTSSGERSRESTNEGSCSDDEDEDGSETIGESEGEQTRDLL